MIPFPNRKQTQPKDEKDEKIENLQAYIGLHLFRLADMRKELLELRRKFKSLEQKKRFELIQNARRSFTKEA